MKYLGKRSHRGGRNYSFRSPSAILADASDRILSHAPSAPGKIADAALRISPRRQSATGEYDRDRTGVLDHLAGRRKRPRPGVDAEGDHGIALLVGGIEEFPGG